MKRTHHDLKLWQESMQLVEGVYRLTSAFPDGERYGLISQMRRAAVSVPSNIAEGAGRSGEKEFLKFLSISRGSLSELETQLLLASRLGYMDGGMEKISTRMNTVFALIGGLMNSLRKKVGA